MAIKRIEANKYRITIELGTNALGRRTRMIKTIYGSKEEAKKKENELNQKYYHLGKKYKMNDLTFSEYTQYYINNYCKSEISRITLHRYEYFLKKINALIGKIKLSKIDTKILDNMYTKLFIGQNGNRLSYNTRYDYYKLINSMLNSAVSWNFIDKNPNKFVLNKPKKETKEKRFYDVSQTNQLIKVLENESIKHRAIILLTLDSGIRRAELAALRWKDIDFDNHTISITKSLKIIDGYVDEARPKTNNSNRNIIVSESTIELLKEYKEWQENEIKMMKNKYKDEGRVFSSKNGKNMNPCSFNHILTKIIRKYNLPPLSFHELRHTSASLLLNSGLDIKSISQRLGHGTSTVTEIYIHSFETSKIKCANVMNEIFKNVKNA